MNKQTIVLTVFEKTDTLTIYREVNRLLKSEGMENMKKIIVARFTHEGKQYVGKREVKMYDESSKVDESLLRDANQGLVLRTQSSIRNAIKQKYGLATASIGGESVDLSSVESV